MPVNENLSLPSNTNDPYSKIAEDALHSASRLISLANRMQATAAQADALAKNGYSEELGRARWELDRADSLFDDVAKLLTDFRAESGSL